MQLSVNKKKLISYISLFSIVLILINNMFYSFNWTDEGFYLSTVNRFYQGDRFFADDWSPTQTYMILLYPFYSLYMQVNGSTEGVYLFFRIITCLFQGLTAFFTFFILSKKWPLRAAVFASFLPVIFSRACINGPSYYVVGFETYLLGLLFLFTVFEIKNSVIFPIGAGLFFALAVLCNPYLALPYIAVSALVLIHPASRKHWKPYLTIWLTTFIVAVAYILTVFKIDRIEDVVKSIHYIFNDPDYGKTLILTIKRLYKMPRLILFPYLLSYSPVLIAGIILKKKSAFKDSAKKVLFLLNTLLFIVSIFFSLDCGSATMPFFHYSLLTALIFNDFNIKSFLSANKKDLLYFVLPGMILAYFFCFASDTGFGVCAIGITLADIGMISVYFKAAKKLDLKFSLIKKIICYIPAVILISVTFFYRLNITYMDALLSPRLIFIPQLNANIEKISAGPAKGLYTAKVFKEQYDSVLSTISQIKAKDGESILISSICPWAHLILPELKTSSPTTFRVPFSDYRIRPYFEEFPKHKFPDYVLLLDKSIYRNDRKNDIENTWLKSKLEEKGYRSTTVSCGVLYQAR